MERKSIYLYEKIAKYLAGFDRFGAQRINGTGSKNIFRTQNIPINVSWKIFNLNDDCMHRKSKSMNFELHHIHDGI